MFMAISIHSSQLDARMVGIRDEGELRKGGALDVRTPQVRLTTAIDKHVKNTNRRDPIHPSASKRFTSLSTRSSSPSTLFRTTVALSSRLFSTPSTARPRISRRVRTRSCSSSSVPSVPWKSAAAACSDERVRMRVSMCGRCGR